MLLLSAALSLFSFLVFFWMLLLRSELSANSLVAVSMENWIGKVGPRLGWTKNGTTD